MTAFSLVWMLLLIVFVGLPVAVAVGLAIRDVIHRRRARRWRQAEVISLERWRRRRHR